MTNSGASTLRTVDSTTEELEFNRLLRSAAILVVDDEPGMRNFLRRTLESRCALLEVAGSAEEAEAVRLRYHFDLLLVDIRLPGLSGLDWLGKLRDRGVRTHVIYMTAYADLEMAISALRSRADDFIMKPFRAEQMFLSMQRTFLRRQIVRENSLLRLQLEQMNNNDGLLADSEIMKTVLALIHRVAPTRSAVVFTGETGTGKATVARLTHRLSRRGGGLVTFNCSGQDNETIDRELFGYSKGAFSQADKSHDGLFVHADKGSLFLKNVDLLSEAILIKLKRVLEEGLIRPLGNHRDISVDVRIMASVSTPVDKLSANSVGPELAFQLNALTVQIPPLRKRGDDLALLVNHFMEQQATQMRLAPVELLHRDWQQLSAYGWPGNVRELKNIVQRCLFLGELPVDSLQSTPSADQNHDSEGFPLTWTMEQVERAHMKAVLKSANNNKSAAARILQVSRKTLERKQVLWLSEDEN